MMSVVPTIVAQTDSTVSKKNLDKVLVTVVEAEIKLDTAERLFEPAAYPVPRKVEVEKQAYSPKKYELNLNSLSHKIRVFGIKPSKQDPLTNNYVRGGFGNFITPYLDVFLGSDRGKQFSYGLRAKHLSSKNGPFLKNVTGSSENELDFAGTYFINKKSSLDLKLNYERLGYKFYGYYPQRGGAGLYPIVDEPLSTEELKQVVQFINLSTDYEIDINDQLTLDYKVGFGLTKDRLNAKERQLIAGVGMDYQLDEKASLLIDVSTFFTKRQDSSSLNRNFISVDPYYVYRADKLTIKGGVGVVYENDTLENRSNFHVYPRVDVEFEMTSHLRAYVGVTGEMVRNSYQSLIKENRFLGANFTLLNTNKAVEFYAGAKGNIHQKLGYNIRLGYQNYKYLHFFTNNPTKAYEFDVIYDDGNTTVVNILGELNYEKTNLYKVNAKVELNNYNMSEGKTAFHRPTFKSSLFAEYNLNKKLSLNTDIFYISGLKSLNVFNGEVVKLNSIVDLNLGAEYRFNKRFSAFLTLNNLLSKEYEYYLYYPVQGFNMMLGATYSF